MHDILRTATLLESSTGLGNNMNSFRLSSRICISPAKLIHGPRSMLLRIRNSLSLAYVLSSKYTHSVIIACLATDIAEN